MVGKKTAYILAVILALGLLPSCSAKNASADMAADMVITNGTIYTEDGKQPQADTAAIKDGIFVYVGNAEDNKWKAYVGDETEVVDLKGKAVIPGIYDSHTHPTAVALSAWKVILPETDNVEELLTFVKEYCEEHPVEEVPYFFGMYYPSTMFGAEGPKKELLDQYVSDRPVRLQDFSDHCCWLNSKALELMGVDKNTPDPTPGLSYFVRDAEGNPTGWVKESATAEFEDNMYKAIGWYPPAEMTPELLQPILDFWHSKGVVGFLDAITEDESVLKTVYELDKNGKLNMYYEGCSLLSDFKDLDNAVSVAKDWQKKYTTEHIKIRTVKFFLDGTNEIGTSSVIEPFSNDPAAKNHGVMNMSQEELTEVMVRLNKENLDFHVHLVGDQAFRTICDATEKAQEICGDDWKIQVELTHCEIVDPADMDRTGELGIIVNWTPHWTGGYFGEAAEEWLGEERFNRMYDFTEMIKSGTVVNYGSDVVSMEEFERSDPFFGMQIANTRIDPQYPLDQEKFPGSVRPPASACLSLEELLKGYTLNGAVEFRMDDKAGSIQEGKYANLSVLSGDLFKTPADEIMNIEPTAVIFEGKVIYGQF